MATQSRPALSERELMLESPDYPGDLTPFWHPVSFAEEVTSTPKRVVLLDTQVVLFRDEHGVVAFRDLCVHRGAALSLGKVTERGHLQCPYHGWEYDRTGACVRIPALPEGAAIPGTARAIRYPAQEMHGLVWVSLVEDPMFPIPPFPGDENNDSAWHTFLAFEEAWETSAGRILENFCDWSHVPFVHDVVLGSSDLPTVRPTPVEEHHDERGHTFSYSYEQVDQSQIYGDGGAATIRRDFVVFLPFFANLYKVRPTGERTLLTMAICPHSAMQTTLWLWISRDHAFDRPDDEYREFSRLVFEQDRRVVQSQRPEQLPVSLRQELHIKLPDAFSVEFRRVFAKLATSRSTTDER